MPIGTNVILSHHDYDTTPSDEALDGLVAQMVDAGADIAKVATTATDVSDSLRMLQLAERSEGASLPTDILTAAICAWQVSVQTGSKGLTQGLVNLLHSQEYGLSCFAEIKVAAV